MSAVIFDTVKAYTQDQAESDPKHIGYAFKKAALESRTLITNTIACLFIMTLILGCKNNVEDNLINKIRTDCGKDKKVACRVVLKDLTHFEWDKMYLFGAWTIS